MDSLIVKPQDIGSKSLDRDALKRSFLEWLVYSVGKDARTATDNDWFTAVALAVRDRVVDRWMDTTRSHYHNDVKRVYYLSLEFLIGRLLRDSMINLHIEDACREALADLDVDFEDLVANEPDAALGNGGLGRLAACFLDSIATQGYPGIGYGIRYEFGLFEQSFAHGWQVEHPEQWLQSGNPWEFRRPESRYRIQFGGRVEEARDALGKRAYKWVDGDQVWAVAYDTPIIGYGGRTVNTLRLWSARAIQDFHFDRFSQGDYMRAVEQKVLSENLSRVLYPNDATDVGKELRLRQEYFFTSASLQDVIRRHLQTQDDLTNLPDKAAIQLNDTHPAIGIAELMRLLVDEHAMEWGRAWDITQRTFAYTNHTLLPEALETWPVGMIERILPRHMQIIYEINSDFLIKAQKKNPNVERLAQLSLIDEASGRSVRMGNLAFIGSHKVNGVSALHTDLMRKTVFAQLHSEFPHRINNKTNGITPRRWLLGCNKPLADSLSARIGSGWVTDLERLQEIADLADDPGFQTEFRNAKYLNKQRLADYIRAETGDEVDPGSMFDVQIKRIHEYKRQLLNLLQTVALYNAIRANPTANWTPRTKIFAGKAAPSYWMAKLIIKLANDIAEVVNHDPAVRDILKVVFLPNYNVTVAEKIIPAADLSEQISTAGKEASGTGNMKLALNGALTIGTLDGANVEIRDAVGQDNIFIFGLDADEVRELWSEGYDANRVIESNPKLKSALDMIVGGTFSPDDPSRFHPLIESITGGGDRFLVTADFDAYVACQEQVATLFNTPEAWTRKAIINSASVGWFSSDRTVQQYADEIWGVRPIFHD